MFLRNIRMKYRKTDSQAPTPTQNLIQINNKYSKTLKVFDLYFQTMHNVFPMQSQAIGKTINNTFG